MTKAATNRGKWLKQASQYLKSNSNTTTPHLDAELILAHVLNMERIALHTHPEITLTKDAQRKANRLLQRASNYPLRTSQDIKNFLAMISLSRQMY